MTQLITVASSATARMTSLEIAEFVGSRHPDVRRTIERLAKRGTIQLPPMAKVQNNQALSPNSKAEAYIFEGETGKRDSIVVVAQLSPEFTARLVDRWQELENAAAQPQPYQLPDFTNPAAAARAWAEQFDTAQRLQIENSAQAAHIEEILPKADGFDLIAADEQTGLTMTQAAKILNIKRETLIDFLQKAGWIYRQNGSWVGYQQHIKAGRLRYKEAEFTDEKTATKTYRPYCHLTNKGVAELGEIWAASFKTVKAV